MIQIDRRIAIAVGVGGILALILAFAIGRTTADSAAASADSNSPTTTAISADASGEPDSPDTSTVDPIDGDPAAARTPETEIPASGIPAFGSEAERDQMMDDLVNAGIIGGTREGILTTADEVCYNLQQLQEQRRRLPFAVRVVWNESLLDLESEDLAAFGIVFNAAPRYLCPEHLEFADTIAYWLGI